MVLGIIDLEETVINTIYCIEEETRLKHIAHSISLGLPSIHDFASEKDDNVAIVGFGPSLVNSWEKIKDFRIIFPCSGSHKFLLEKGLKPSDFESWYHVEVDPHEHKCELLGTPQYDIKYLIASACNPKYFEKLSGYDVQLWHLYDGSILRNLPLVYPRGDIIVTGGSNVGLRAIVLARVFGYKNLHIFGFDNSFPDEDGLQHASFHPKRNQDVYMTSIDGVRNFYTTPSMVHYAREFFHEISSLPDVTVKLYGDGLLQNWANKIIKSGGLQFSDRSVVSIKMPKLISDEYRNLNKKLHASKNEYGSFGNKYIEYVLKIMQDNSHIKTVLDYGCGKGELAKSLPFKIFEYDPCVEGKDKDPEPADLVICTDVLEHVERDYLEAVIGDIARCTKTVAFIVINLCPAKKFLEDGRNAHIIQESKEWWADQLLKYFDIKQAEIISLKSDEKVYNEGEIRLIVAPKLHEEIKDKTEEIK